MDNERVKESVSVGNEAMTTRQDKKKQGRGKTAAGGRILLHILQHISLVMAVVLAVSVIYGSYIRVSTRKDLQYYNLHEEQSGIDFEQSHLFNDILGKSITDVICYGAIRGQMESDGKYNGKKEVDVTAFANRYEGTASEYITANYYLEDLLKWAKNGFEYKDVFMTGKEADQFLSRMNTVTTVNYGDEYSGGTISFLNSDLESITKVVDVSGNLLDSGEIEREDILATVLNNRYHTIDGKNIEDHVASWDEYYALCSNVRKAAEDLNINYEEYLECREYYDGGNSNLVYFIRRTIGKEVQIFTNMDTKVSDVKTLKKELTELCNSYVYYDPLTMEYDTNTLIEEETLRYVLNGYEYAYPEDTQIMIGVREAYIADDAFSAAEDSFINYIPNFGQNLGAAIVCTLLYMILLVVLTVLEGRVCRKESGEIVIRLRQDDHFPTELMAAAAVVSIGAWAMILRFLWDKVEQADHTTITVFAGTMALAFSLLFSFFYYSFVRRWKAGTLWKDSLIRKGIVGIKKTAIYAFDHSSLLIKVLLPFVLFVGMNIGGLIIGLMGDEKGLAAGLIIVLIIDVLVGIYLYRSAQARQNILEGIKKIQTGDIEYKVDETGLHGDELVLAKAVNSIGDSVKEAVETSMKDERLKADLITNVSHDIKTPLTSIINYVDLLKRQNIENPKAKEYITVLDAKSQRLKQLTDDLVEASKISSGNIVLHWEKINLVELLNQSIGEFSEKFEEKALNIVMDAPKGTVYIEADSRRIWRVIENLFNNIYKYALPGTRVYIELLVKDGEEKQVELSVKNISAQPLKVNVEELTERFIRGDESRTTEGSGLGLSIAKNLTEIQKGKFEIVMDGDLFKVILTFPLFEKQ
ncbi:MAG: HAMP domain-containing histidine kinase [Lachnospiraceae bacterium]|nr:HAMP domain-containing histidine kinase [Lachnospiraceae bacterium]